MQHAKVTFKEFVSEAVISDKARKIAAEFLDTTPDHLEAVDDATSTKVLDTGKEMGREIIKAASGSIIIRAFKAIGLMFARIEAPAGDHVMYKKDNEDNNIEKHIKKSREREIDLSW